MYTVDAENMNGGDMSQQQTTRSNDPRLPTKSPLAESNELANIISAGGGIAGSRNSVGGGEGLRILEAMKMKLQSHTMRGGHAGTAVSSSLDTGMGNNAASADVMLDLARYYLYFDLLICNIFF